jgi:hypothetical protein
MLGPHNVGTATFGEIATSFGAWLITALAPVAVVILFEAFEIDIWDED